MTDTFWNWAPLSHPQGGKGGKKSMKLNWNFLERDGGEVVQNKNLLWGDWGYFLELHILERLILK